MTHHLLWVSCASSGIFVSSSPLARELPESGDAPPVSADCSVPRGQVHPAHKLKMLKGCLNQGSGDVYVPVYTGRNAHRFLKELLIYPATFIQNTWAALPTAGSPGF